ncbi:hypothetical protein GCM10010156_44840 [Planobispora rosea]|uniref:aldo/keto reductase n=1 Tax=Planobispora rosea TaxID=35762 RepID=UPI001996AECB|nr:aldo/keto reductase [Planobispora rosea]GGS81080.1 hypothetical protein GCM10010156_44840 [Planobispora rosea]
MLGRRLLERVQHLLPVAADCGLSAAQLAIARVLRQPGASSVVAGATRPEQATENASASGKKIDDVTLARVDEILGDLIDRDPAKTAQMMAVKPERMETAAGNG